MLSVFWVKQQNRVGKTFKMSKFDFVKFLESSSLLIDLYIISKYGYALASPCASLTTIIIISYNKEHYLDKFKCDLEKILISKEDLENDKN